MPPHKQVDILRGKIYDAIRFICRGFGIPDAVILQAAEAALNVIGTHIEETNIEAKAKENKEHGKGEQVSVLKEN